MHFVSCLQKRNYINTINDVRTDNWKELMLKLKLKYFGHLMWRTDSLEKTLMLGKIEDGRKGNDRGWAGWMASLTQWTWVWTSSGSWWWTGKPCGMSMLQSMELQRVRHDWAIELNWINYIKTVKTQNLLVLIILHILLILCSWGCLGLLHMYGENALQYSTARLFPTLPPGTLLC